MGQVVAVANMKGGVGKSSIVVSLAETFAARGLGPVLVIDVDTQASSSCCLAGDDRLRELIESGQTIDHYLEALLTGKAQDSLELYVARQVTLTVAPKVGQLDVALIPSSTNLRISERKVLHQLTKNNNSLTAIEQGLTDVLAADLATLRKDYKWIIFDCAPGISPLTSAAISCANLVVVPTIPDYISCLGLDAFLNNVMRDMTHQAAHRPPHVLVTRSLARSRRGFASVWNLDRGKKQSINTHAEFEERLAGLAKSSPDRMKLFFTKFDESLAIPAAMAIGANSHRSMKNVPTYLQKYPEPLKDVLLALSKEIEKVLR